MSATMKGILRIILTASLFLLLPPLDLVAGEILHGKVVKVIDGDSVLVRVGNTTKEIRLWGIDCPEYDQPYASAAKKRTVKLVKGNISVEVKGRDGYNRVLGVVYRDGVCVNRQLVSQGAAWVYDYYCRSAKCKEWARLETKARSQKKGLWRYQNPIPPWKWRKAKR